MNTVQIIAFTHRQFNFDEIGLFHLDDKQRIDILTNLKTNLDIDELMYLSTCNRVEFIVSHEKKITKTFVEKLIKQLLADQLPANLKDIAEAQALGILDGVTTNPSLMAKEGITGKNNILEVWPNLEVYFHGGVNFNPYREQYKKLIPKKDFQYYETYNASEGFFAIQDRNGSKELLLMLDYGIFYEFIPMTSYKGENSKTIPLSKVKKDIDYALIITTNSGLWRYLIGDTIRFTSLDPYRIKITGRTRHYINVFGEEVNIENAEDALKLACKKTNATIIDYTVGPIFMKGKKSGGHEWVIEFNKAPENMNYFTELLDNALKSINSDYEAKRYNSLTLAMPIIHVAKKGLFYTWLKSKDKLGGQHKIPRLSNSRAFIEELLIL